MSEKKRTWGKTTLKYDPVQRVCWYYSIKGKPIKCEGLSSYGLDREEMPND